MEFRILGPLEVVIDGEPMELGSPKQRALLVALVLHPNEIVPTDRLIEWLWANNPPRTAQHSVQIYVSELRKTLVDGAEPVIETRPPGYLLHARPDQIDATRFQLALTTAEEALRCGDTPTAADMLRTALGVWRGQPLADFAYDEFAQPHIRRLEAMWATAVEELAMAELELGRVTDVLSLLDTLVEHDPLAEAPRRLQMLALHKAGRQVDALRTYRRYRSLVGEELGLEPSPELQTLEERILLRDESLEPVVVAAPLQAVTPATNPYKGLRAFEEEDADNFFGREAMTEDLIDRLERGVRLLSVVGPSGSGKSSVVRAGLVPRLRQGRLPGSERWPIATMMPGRHPFEELEAALHRVAPGTRGLALSSGDTALLRTALRVLGDDASDLVLVIDQFEELFTLVDERTRRSFLLALVAAVEGPHSRVRVVVTLRADFYDRPLVYPALASLFVAGAVTVTPLEPAELEAAIREPASRAGIQVESALVTAVLADMLEHPGALPLLQFTLSELFEFRDGPELTLAGYRRLGGLRGTLTRRAEAILSTMNSHDRDLAKQLLLRLVRVDRGGQSTRRRVPLSEARSLGSDGSVDEIIARLGSERLLMFDRDLATGEAAVEVTHEAILSGWTRLRDWIEELRADLQRRDVLGSAAADWEAAGRHDDYLLSGTRLASFESWRNETTLVLSRLESVFLRASSDHRDSQAIEESRLRRRARRLRVGQLTGVGMLAGALAFFAPATIESLLNPPPDVVLVIDQPTAGTVGLGQLGLASFEQALAEFDVDGGIRVRGDNPNESVEEVIADLARQDVDLVINYLGGFFDWAFAADHPETTIAMFDSPVELPNVASLVFAEHEGSFLAGAAAALTSQTGVIGFIGGVDVPVIWRFEMGFEAGARHVRPDIDVRADYLGDYFELSGFGSPTFAGRVAESMYRDGADVIFTVAGDSGHGTLDAAERLSVELGRHLWAIGVDVDEYHTSQQLLELDWPAGAPPWNVAGWPPHILTSMIKRYDNAIAGLVEDYAHGTLKAGVQQLGLAEEGVGYSTSGGHITHLVPVLDELSRRIASSEIVVPFCPPGREELC
ncbi:MAG TPA: BTAD domain-containing putative transcriptional regulator [Acidimicrobiia bacterium]|nr:BTAD domain-containing putative transcriptional regulator [Acidimicrobiia bacterium]